MTTFSPYSACQHNIRMVYLSDHNYNTEGDIMEEIPAGGCFYIYFVGNFSSGRLPEEEELVAIPFVMRTLRMAGLGSAPLVRCIRKTRRSRRYICGVRASGKGTWWSHARAIL